MAPIGTLWGIRDQRRTKVILSVAAINGLELEMPEWSFSNKPPEFSVKFPLGMIPAFEAANGLKLIEGGVIARYLSEMGSVDLLGSTPKEVAIVDQWVHFVEREVGMPSLNIPGIIWGYYYTFNAELLDNNYQHLVRGLNYLESHLATQSSGYMALGKLTLADLMLAGITSDAASSALGATERAQYPHVFAHYDKIGSDERLTQFFDKKKFVDVRITGPRSYPIP